MTKRLRQVIDKDSRMPMFAQIKEILEREIREGVYPPGQPLPSEADLSNHFQVSRMTVRQAVMELVYDGLLHRTRGKGTFIRETKPFKRLFSSASVSGLYENIAAQGKELVSEIRSVKLAPATPAVANHLQVDPGTRVLQLERLRSVDETPIVWQISYLPHHLVPGLEEEDLSNASLNRRLQERYGFRFTRARTLITAHNATMTEAGLLHVRVGAALLQMEKVTYTNDDIPVEYVILSLPPDRYQFVIEQNQEA